MQDGVVTTEQPSQVIWKVLCNVRVAVGYLRQETDQFREGFAFIPFRLQHENVELGFIVTVLEEEFFSVGSEARLLVSVEESSDLHLRRVSANGVLQHWFVIIISD